MGHYADMTNRELRNELESYGLARSFQYFMDARVAPGQERAS